MVVGRMVEFDSSLLPQSDNYTVELTLFVSQSVIFVKIIICEFIASGKQNQRNSSVTFVFQFQVCNFLLSQHGTLSFSISCGALV